MSNKLFSILENKEAKLMLDMAKEKITESEKANIIERFKSIDGRSFRDLCIEHQFEGMAASFLKKADCLEDEFWKETYDKCYLKAYQKLCAAKEICENMHDHNIEMIVLKNGGILADIIDDPAKMPMGDIDTLIRKKDFLKAYELMLQDGYSFEYSNEYEIPDINNAYRDGDAEYVKMIAKDHRLVCEVAWRVVAGRWIRPDCEPDTEEMFDNMHTAKGTYIGILSPEDNLVQVCIHTAKHSYVRAPGLRLHLDVERIVNNCSIDWDLFLSKIENAHTKTAAYYSLYIPSVLFGTQVPAYVLDRLRPKKSKRKKIENRLANASLLHPHGKKFSKIQYLLFQTSLYDRFGDICRNLYPSSKWLKMRYDFSNSFLIPYYIIIRLLDLVGIRKKQK